MNKERIEEARKEYGLPASASTEDVIRAAHQDIAPGASLASFSQRYFDYNPIKIRGGGSDWYALLEKSVAGLTLGLSDELAAAVAGAVLAYEDGEDWAAHYASRRKYLLDRRATTSQRLGTKATMADMGGMVVGTILTGGGSAVSQIGLRTAAKVGVQGAVRGGIRGATMSEGEDLAERAHDAVKGAAVGAVASALPYSLGTAARSSTALVQSGLNKLGTPGEWASLGAQRLAKAVFAKSGLADRAGETATGRAIADLAKAVSRSPKSKVDPRQLALFQQSAGGPLQWASTIREALAGGIGATGQLVGGVLDKAAPIVSPLASAGALASSPITNPDELGEMDFLHQRPSMAESPVGRRQRPPLEAPSTMKDAESEKPKGVSTSTLLRIFNSDAYDKLSYEESAELIGRVLSGDVPKDEKKLKRFLKGTN